MRKLRDECADALYWAVCVWGDGHYTWQAGGHLCYVPGTRAMDVLRDFIAERKLPSHEITSAEIKLTRDASYPG